MQIDNLKIPLSKPPFKRVDLYIYFPSNLFVAERRSAYYNLIKTDYPLISIPENQKLQYNFGDCNFFTQDYSNMVGIAINYFSFSSIKYNKFDEFFERFKKVWLEFKKLYSIDQVTNISLDYDNLIRAEKHIGYSFSDYFDIGFSFPGKTEKKFVAIEGEFIFSIQDGYCRLIFKPISPPERNILEPDFNYTLECRCKMEGKNIETLEDNLNKMHISVEDIFFSSLSQKYYDSIK